MKKSLFARLLYAARDWRSRALFDALREHSHGDVLDVGGWDFVITAMRKGVPFATWTTLDNDPERKPDDEIVRSERISVVHGDGCAMELDDESFDTVLAVQVLEHVFEPIRMVEEISRVLRAGGKAVILVPQTSTTHLAPHYHQNVSRYWIHAAVERAGLEIVEHRALGGVWSSMASHLFYFFLQVARFPGTSDPAIRRPWLFYPLVPFMMIWALVALPVCLFFSLGDLAEEPNNHLVVAAKAKR